MPARRERLFWLHAKQTTQAAADCHRRRKSTVCEGLDGLPGGMRSIREHGSHIGPFEAVPPRLR